MVLKQLKTNKTIWMDFVNPTDKEIEDLTERYNFHELDREAILEENQRVRVDTYDDYIFIIMQFPKFDIKSKRYFTNEFNIFISKKYLITIRWHSSSSIEKIFEHYNTTKNKQEVNT